MRRAVVAGLVTVVVGYTGAFAVVLTGLRSVGATPAQAASGLAVLCLTMGVATIGMAWRYRMPITIAWSTPGAALLATAGVPDGGWPAAVFAFIVTGVLLVITGLVPWLGRLVARIPTTLAQAMLAGVLVPICLVPVQSVLTSPQVIAPVLLAWLVMLAWKPRWAAATSVGLALVIAVIAVALGPGLGSLPAPGGALVFTLPLPSWSAAVGLALPLWLVTMASQNIPGAAVLGTFGYRAPWRPALVVTGLGTVQSGHRSAATRSTTRRSAPRWRPPLTPAKSRPGAGGQPSSQAPATWPSAGWRRPSQAWCSPGRRGFCRPRRGSHCSVPSARRWRALWHRPRAGSPRW